MSADDKDRDQDSGYDIPGEEKCSQCGRSVNIHHCSGPCCDPGAGGYHYDCSCGHST